MILSCEETLLSFGIYRVKDTAIYLFTNLYTALYPLNYWFIHRKALKIKSWCIVIYGNSGSGALSEISFSEVYVQNEIKSITRRL